MKPNAKTATVSTQPVSESPGTQEVDSDHADERAARGRDPDAAAHLSGRPGQPGIEGGAGAGADPASARSRVGSAQVEAAPESPGNGGEEEAGLNALGEIAARVGRIQVYLDVSQAAYEPEKALADATEAAEYFVTVRAALRRSGKGDANYERADLTQPVPGNSNDLLEKLADAAKRVRHQFSLVLESKPAREVDEALEELNSVLREVEEGRGNSGGVAEEGLPPELVKALRDPSNTIQADRDYRLANGQTLAEHLEEWRNAPSNTVSAPKGAPMPDVVILDLDRENAQKLLDGFPEALVGIDSDEQRELRAKLRAALDSPPVEESSEYRVVHEIRGEDGLWEIPLADPRSLIEAESRARKAPRSPRRFNVRVQARTITTLSDGSSLIGPWSDLEGEGGDDG